MRKWGRGRKAEDNKNNKQTQSVLTKQQLAQIILIYLAKDAAQSCTLVLDFYC